MNCFIRSTGAILLCLFSIDIYANGQIERRVLDNGLTVIVKSTDSMQRVSVQLWIPVGAQHEVSGQKGVAHLIEHMIFKGTEKYAESDYNFLVDALAAECNAATSYDRTFYFFNLPAICWHEVLPLMADCLINCTFKQDHINSELKTVIQELKMYKDNYVRTMIQELISAIFYDHPYHYPIIGYKQDLCNAKSEKLKEFYKNYYRVQDAVLVIVGNVDSEKAFLQVQQEFGSIEPSESSFLIHNVHQPQLSAKSITLYRDVNQPLLLLGWEIPGSNRDPYCFTGNVLSNVLTLGINSRLHQLLVDEKKCARSVKSFQFKFSDGGLFGVLIHLFDVKHIKQIIKEVQTVLKNIKYGGITKEEIQRTKNYQRSVLYEIDENHYEQASTIAEGFLITREERFFLHDWIDDEQDLQKHVQDLITDYLRPSIMHQVKVLPLSKEEIKHWQQLQIASDTLDAEILSAISRESLVEPACQKHEIKPVDTSVFSFPLAHETQLENDLMILSHHRSSTKKISLVLDLKADILYDCQKLPGLYKILSKMLLEGGTKNYTKQEFVQTCESNGILFSITPGRIIFNFFAENFEKVLSLLQELLINPVFDEKALEHAKRLALADLEKAYDDQYFVAHDIINQHIYKDHPKAMHGLGTVELIQAITRNDLVAFHQKYFTPHQTYLAIVGNIEGYDVDQLVKKYFSSWQGPQIEDIDHPLLTANNPENISQYMNRDQVRLCFARLSIDRFDPDYYKLVLFDHVLADGMNSRLFKLREQEGIFYTIQGSLINRADHQPGMILISTIVSIDRLDEAKKLILQCLEHAVDSLTEDELVRARNMIYFDLLDQFSQNVLIAQSFINQVRFNLPQNYFNTLPEQLAHITVDEVKKAVKRVLDPHQLSIIQVGRMS